MRDSDSQNGRSGVWQAILQAAEGLPPPLRFVIVFGVLLALIILARATIPDELLPLIYLLFIGGSAMYIWWERQQAKERDKEREARERERQDQREYERALAQQSVPSRAEPEEPEKPKVEPVSTAELATIYLRELVSRCGHLFITSIDPRAKQSDAARLELQSLFTELDVMARPERDEKSRLHDSPEVGSVHEEERREPALAVISQHSRLVLLGKPGSGKSTLVSFISLCLAGEHLGREDVNLARLAQQGWALPRLLPVRIILRDYAARGLPYDQGLWQFIEDELSLIRYNGGNLAAYVADLRTHLQQRGGMLLLDGLDEVPEAHRRREQLRQAVADFARDFEKVRILVTSRPYAYSDPEWQLPGFERTDLLDFSPEQIATYIDRWYAATSQKDPDLSSDQATAYAGQLKGEVERNPNLAELAPRPLLLALMVSLHRWRGGGALPQEREKLYDQSVELLLDLWQRPKQLYDAQGQPLREETSALTELGITTDDLRRALSAIAFQVHRDQPEQTGTADVPGSLVASALFDAPGRKAGVDFDRIIQYVEERAGLLVERGQDSQGRRIYAFPHRTFQEYLAACHLLEANTFPGELAELACTDPSRWREALLLAASRANAPFTQWALVEALCWETSPLDEATVKDVEWWGALLAGAMLLETELFRQPAAPDRNKLDRVRHWLTALVARGALLPPDRAEAGRILGVLKDPRPGVELRGGLPDIDWIAIEPGPFIMGSDKEKDQLADGHETPQFTCTLIREPYAISRYPITVAQYQAFVDAGGYEQERYWTRAGWAWRTEEQIAGPGTYPEVFQTPNHPQVGVSWYEAAAFCNWLSEHMERPVTLPSEAQWERAARHTDLPDLCPADVGKQGKPGGEAGGRIYPWGGEFHPTRCNMRDTGIGSTSAVGIFPTGNAECGVADMSGNVLEWCRTKWLDDYEGYEDKVDDDLEGTELRVVRGGSFFDREVNVRCACRYWLYPYYRYDHIGFRVVSPGL